MYTVIQKLSAKDKRDNNGEDFYLNHAYLSSMSFGSRDMAWTGDQMEATEMLKRAKAKHAGKRLRFEIAAI